MTKRTRFKVTPTEGNKKPVYIHARNEEEAKRIYNEEYGPQALEFSGEGAGYYRAAQSLQPKGGSLKDQPFIIAFGKWVSDIGLGAEETTYRLQTMFADDESRKKLNDKIDTLLRYQANNEAAFKHLKERFPFDTMAGEELMYAAMRGGPVSSAIKAAIMEMIKPGEPQQRMARGLTGAGVGALGGFLGETVSHAINPRLRGEKLDMLKWADKNGIRPFFADTTGWDKGFLNPKIVENWAARHPGGIDVMKAAAERNQIAANKIAARSFGQDIDETGTISAAVFAKGEKDIGAMFDAVRNVPRVNGYPPITMSKNLEQAAKQVIRDQLKLGHKANKDLLDSAKAFLSLAKSNGRITPDTYLLWRTKLSNDSNAAFKGSDSVSGRGYDSLLEAIDGDVDSSLRAIGKSDVADNLIKARELWGNLKTLEGGGVVEAGNVMLPRLSTALRNSNPSKYKTGGGDDLWKLGRFGEMYKNPKIGPNVPTDIFSTIVFSPVSSVAMKINTSPVATWIPRKMAGKTAAPAIAEASETGIRGGVTSILRMLFPRLEREQ